MLSCRPGVHQASLLHHNLHHNGNIQACYTIMPGLLNARRVDKLLLLQRSDGFLLVVDGPARAPCPHRKLHTCTSTAGMTSTVSS